MYISKATKETGLASRTIRYYEDLGLISPKRLQNGYRYYGANDIARLRFVKRARSLGFPLNDCRALVRLVEDDARHSRDVKLLAEDHLATVTTKYAQLDTIRDRLHELIAACPGDDAAACPIIDELTAQGGRG